MLPAAWRRAIPERPTAPHAPRRRQNRPSRRARPHRPGQPDRSARPKHPDLRARKSRVPPPRAPGNTMARSDRGSRVSSSITGAGSSSDSVLLDEAPVDVEAEAGFVTEVQMAVVQLRMLAEQAEIERVAVGAAVRLDAEHAARQREAGGRGSPARCAAPP